MHTKDARAKAKDALDAGAPAQRFELVASTRRCCSHMYVDTAVFRPRRGAIAVQVCNCSNAVVVLCGWETVRMCRWRCLHGFTGGGGD